MLEPAIQENTLSKYCVSVRETLFNIELNKTLIGILFITLAERIDVPAASLMEACFDLKIEKEDSHIGDWYSLSEQDKVAIELGIKSEEELEKICEYYQCKYYDLDEWMVEKYYENKAEGI
jgi:hypothetical protein